MLSRPDADHLGAVTTGDKINIDRLIRKTELQNLSNSLKKSHETSKKP